MSTRTARLPAKVPGSPLMARAEPFTRSVFSNNVINDSPPEQDFSEGKGGALELLLADGQPISIVSSEISGNTIVLRPGVFMEGAGIYYYGTTPLTIINTTISGNQSESGAAIESSCNLQLVNSTISGNIAPKNSVPAQAGVATRSR
jgi:hypothetical protein